MFSIDTDGGATMWLGFENYALLLLSELSYSMKMCHKMKYRSGNMNYYVMFGHFSGKSRSTGTALYDAWMPGPGFPESAMWWNQD